MSFRSVLKEANESIVIEKSRFIGYVKPIESEEEALAFIEKIKKKHWDATHNVPVYVIGEKYEIQRYSDDGEPSGTAGIPVLEMLKKEKYTNLCIVMTRYFGGVKLGTGGLVRAYTQTGKLALEAGQPITKALYAHLIVNVDYHYHGKLLNFIERHPEIVHDQTDYTDRVFLSLRVLPEDLDDIKGKLVELTDATLDIIEKEATYLTILNGAIWNGE